MSIPRYVAICGAPGSGKSTVAKILTELYGAVSIDDGYILRKACAVLYSQPVNNFTTQEGKQLITNVCGQDYTNRELLGDLGTVLENFYGDQFMPEQALRQADCWTGVTMEKPPFFVFPSVRKNQGKSYLARGGMVLEIIRPGYEALKEFDKYDTSLVDFYLTNDGDLAALERRVVALFDDMAGSIA